MSSLLCTVHLLPAQLLTVCPNRQMKRSQAFNNKYVLNIFTRYFYHKMPVSLVLALHSARRQGHRTQLLGGDTYVARNVREISACRILSPKASRDSLQVTIKTNLLSSHRETGTHNHHSSYYYYYSTTIRCCILRSIYYSTTTVLPLCNITTAPLLLRSTTTVSPDMYYYIVLLQL